MPQHRLQRRALHPIVARAGRGGGPMALAALGVLEQVRRIAAPVHRRTAELRQPDRLHPRNPGRRRRASDPARPIMVPVRPPPLQVLGPEHPVFAMRPIDDGRPRLRRPIRLAGVEPVEPVPARDAGRQIGRVRRPRPRARVHPALARAPVGQRRIPVDGDIIDVRIGPQRIQMEHHLPARLPPEILTPVGRIGQLHPRPDHRPAFRRQRPELLNRWKAPVRIPRPGHAAHLRADQQPVRPLLRRDPGIVQRHPP